MPAVPTKGTTPRRTTDFACLTLVGLAALHGVWGTGSAWPTTSPTTLANAVGGREPMPGPAACWTVAGLLTSAAAILHAANRIPPQKTLMPEPLMKLGIGVIASTLSVRATGVVGSALPMVPMSRSFRVLNAVAYSPLCGWLAWASWRQYVAFRSGPHNARLFSN